MPSIPNSPDAQYRICIGQAVPGRNDGEVFEGGLPPLQELEPLLVPLELFLLVLGERIRSPRHVDLQGVVDHEVHGAQGVDLGGVALQASHCVPHGCEIDHEGDAGEILKDDPGGFEGDFGLNGSGGTQLVEEIFQLMMFSTSSLVTLYPSQFRIAHSSSTLMAMGS